MAGFSCDQSFGFLSRICWPNGPSLFSGSPSLAVTGANSLGKGSVIREHFDRRANTDRREPSPRRHLSGEANGSTTVRVGRIVIVRIAHTGTFVSKHE
jgi:hypothetical protein